MSRPQADEYAGFFAGYVDRVPEGDIVKQLETQGRSTEQLLASIGEEKASYRYAPEKWSIKQVIGHMTDAERVFLYRLLAIARGEQQSLPGFDENEYMANSNFDGQTLAELTEGFASTRRAMVALARSLDDEAWGRRGIANNNAITARAMAWVAAGHERHHLNVLRERYGIV